MAANALTLANAVAGFLALTLAARGSRTEAARCILAGAAFDGLDGRVARWTGTASALGAQLDSLADAVTFVVAPSFMAWASDEARSVHLGVTLGGAIYVVAGLYRLARFNVEGPAGRHFVGMPTPLAAVAVVLLSPGLQPGPCAALLASLAGLMASRVPFWKP